MNLGWLDALALSEATLPAALTAGFGAAEQQTDFGVVRRRSALIAIAQAGFNMQMGTPARGLKLKARNASVRALAVPPFSDVMARAFTMHWL